MTSDLERSELINALAGQRRFLLRTVDGVSDEQAAARTTVSELCLGGIIKHVAQVEANWVRFIEEGPSAMGEMGPAAFEAHAASFRMEPGETLQNLIDRYAMVAKETERVINGAPSLDANHPLPERPWFEPGAHWSVRQVALHILAETAQHSGHADIIREAFDGAKTMG
jgi:uncharacterized protein DUF664